MFLFRQSLETASLKFVYSGIVVPLFMNGIVVPVPKVKFRLNRYRSYCRFVDCGHDVVHGGPRVVVRGIKERTN